MEKTFTLLISGALFLMTACGEAPHESFSELEANTNNQAISLSGDYHKIYGENKESLGFEGNVKRFLSFNLPANQFGSISALKDNALEGIFFKMNISLDSETQAIQDFSLSVKVKDSFVGSVNPKSNKSYEPFELFMRNEGEESRTRLTVTGDHFVDEKGIPLSGDLQLEFQDNHTTLQFVGTVKDSIFHGKVYFRNHMHYMNLVSSSYHVGEQGALGSFQAPICQLFVCSEAKSDSAGENGE